MSKIIMHIDVNNAFLSWTALDLLKSGYKQDIREIEAVIGGEESKRRGIVLAKSIPAKEKGVFTAETLYSARAKCPNLKIYPPNGKLYNEMSNKLFKLLESYTPDIEIVSVDECFIDYTPVKSLYGDVLEFSYMLKDEIKKELGFTVNIGIAHNKLCAKMASDFLKPDKVHTLYPNEIKEKMWNLPVGELYGVGRRSNEKLISIGINTIGDLANSSKEILYKYFKNQSEHMIDSANGIGSDIVVSIEEERKGMSRTITLTYDYYEIEEINKELEIIATSLSRELRRKNKYTSVIAVIVKDMYFKSYTHQTKLNNATNITKEIFETAKKLFKDSWNNTPIRLIGIRLDSLSDSFNYQISMFEQLEERKDNEKLEMIIDNLKSKYGNNIIKKGE